MPTQFKMPKFDKDIFNPAKSSILCDHVLNDGEGNKFLEYLYDYIDMYPVIKPITDLLKASVHFRAATTVDPYFVAIREVNHTQNDYRKVLETMAKALKKAHSEMKNFQKNPQDAKLFQDAFRYALASVKKGMQLLKKNDDPIYLNLWQGSSLQRFLKEQNIEV